MIHHKGYSISIFVEQDTCATDSACLGPDGASIGMVAPSRFLKCLLWITQKVNDLVNDCSPEPMPVERKSYLLKSAFVIIPECLRVTLDKRRRKHIAVIVIEQFAHPLIMLLACEEVLAIFSDKGYSIQRIGPETTLLIAEGLAMNSLKSQYLVYEAEIELPQ